MPHFWSNTPYHTRRCQSSGNLSSHTLSYANLSPSHSSLSPKIRSLDWFKSFLSFLLSFCSCFVSLFCKCSCLFFQNSSKKSIWNQNVLNATLCFSLLFRQPWDRRASSCLERACSLNSVPYQLPKFISVVLCPIFTVLLLIILRFFY